MTTIQTITVLGAGGLGFVLGWTLYFANRGKSGNISTSDLAAIAAVIAGGAIAQLMGNVAGEGTERGLVFGGYGIGLFLGFIGYFVLLRRATGADTRDETLELALSAPVMGGSRGPASRATSRSVASMTADRGKQLERSDNAVLSARLSAAKTTLETLAGALGTKQDEAEKAGDTKTADEIMKMLAGIDRLLVQINTKLALIVFSQSDVAELLDVVSRETTAIEKEAERMKKITAQIETVNEALASLTSLSSTLEKLVA